MQEPNTRLFTRLSIVWLIASLVLVAVVYGVLAWAIPRGFDWTDEAWVYSLISSNRIAVGEAWGFQHVLHPLFVATGQSVIAFRVIRLVGYFLVSAFLLVVAHRTASALGWTLRLTNWLLILAVSQIGTFVAWAYPPRYLGYNEISSWLTQVGAGLIVLLVVSRITAKPVVGPRIVLSIWVGLGAIVVLLVAVKITTGIVFGALVIAALFISRPTLVFSRRVLTLAVGVVVGLLLLLVSGFPFFDYAKNLLSLIFDDSARSAYDHPVGELLKTYGLSFAGSVRTILLSITFFVVLVSLLLGLLSARVSRQAAGLVAATAGIFGVLTVISLFVWPVTNVPFADLGYFTLFTGSAALILVTLWLGVSRGGGELTSQAKWVVIFGCIVVIATPFAGAVGTNNGIIGQLLYSSTIWAVALAFLLVFLGQRLALRGHSGLSTMPPVILVCLLLLSAIAVRGDVVNHPYRTAPYALQQSPTNATHLQGMLLTAQEAEWADWISSQARSLKAGSTPTIAISSPGGILTFNNSPFASPWVETFWPVSFRSITAACADHKAPTKLFVLQPGNAKAGSQVVKQTVSALQDCGISFPGDFVKAAVHPSKNKEFSMTIWKLSRP
ncbi:hypothetical protein [Lacisediminihabitans profunda]|uniref:Glycosyltransferase RgtA/B/C/D-like domain-containing protein n=1 Tax=Lacisediminihabitans profunda TaxID=2594790 RepID=A0A5C8UKC8_9MICO|nr:hypothetical protein [Lacisediminihabitans profunda]TXN28802.1 hypothetical protein FVP33_16570 [Lacisediminihabitans profunda]